MLLLLELGWHTHLTESLAGIRSDSVKNPNQIRAEHGDDLANLRQYENSISHYAGNDQDITIFLGSARLTDEEQKKTYRKEVKLSEVFLEAVLI